MAACLLSYPNEYSFCYCNAYAVCLSERTNDGERSGPSFVGRSLVVRWSSSFQVQRRWMQDRAARLGTMGHAAILPPDLGVFPFFLSNERILSSP